MSKIYQPSELNTYPIVLVLFLVLMCHSVPSFAFLNKGKGPVQIESDSAELDNKLGIGTYTGHVRVLQNGALLEADVLVLELNQGRIEKATATGLPATYQRPDPTKPLKASSKTIIYEARKEQLTFLKDAKLQQGQDTLQGPRIEYYIPQERVISQGRTIIVLQPKPSKQ